jgi:hypothetical protein
MDGGTNWTVKSQESPAARTEHPLLTEKGAEVLKLMPLTGRSPMLRRLADLEFVLD